MLLMTPPQHGKSLSVIDFIAWAIGNDPELHVIYSSFSDRLGVRANLRLQRALDSAMYRRIFPGTRLNNKHIVTIAERSLRNHEVLEFVGHEGYVRNTTVPLCGSLDRNRSRPKARARFDHLAARIEWNSISPSL